MKRYIRSSIESYGIRVGKAGQSSDPDELARFANDPDWEVRSAVAGNWNTPAEILAELAHDDRERVIWHVINNQKVPTHILRECANSDSFTVRRWVAESRNTPAEILADLANDKIVPVMQAALANPNLPKDVLAKFRQGSDEQDEEFWSLEVESIRDIKAQIKKGVAAGCTSHDVFNYLDQLLAFDIIDDTTYTRLESYAFNTLKWPNK